MKLKLSIFIICMLCIAQVSGQSLAVNTTGAVSDNSAILDVSSTNKGVLIPRVSTTQRNSILTPARGLMVYDSTLNQFAYYDGTSWQLMSAGSSSATWTVNGTHQFASNTGNVGIGTGLPSQKLHVKGNLLIDSGRLVFNNTGQSVFIGEGAGLSDDLTMNNNVFVGYEAGKSNSTGEANTFVGTIAGANVTTGSLNTAIGTAALDNNTTGGSNVAVGRSAMSKNSTGSNNVAVGEGALSDKILGSHNVVIGGQAMSYGTNNSFNVAVGYQAGYLNQTGNANVFLGNNAGASELGSNKLYIDNSGTTNPLIYGNFAADSLKINGTLTVNNAYTFPTNAGASNYLLQTNGTGQTNWVDPSSIAITEADPQVASVTVNTMPKWNGSSLVDGQITDNGTNIGIGTSSPSEKLDVNGKTKTNSIQVTNGAGSGFILQSDASGNGAWVNPASLSIVEADPQVSSTISNTVPKWNGITLTDGLIVDDGTNIGIGTSSPSSKLHVKGNLNVDSGHIVFNNSGNSVFVGESAGQNDDLSDNRNIMIGYQAGQLGSTGNNSIGIGYQALKNNTSDNNVAIGNATLITNTTGYQNTAIGNSALTTNSSGRYNTAIGSAAIKSNTNGSNNVAVGHEASFGNTGGSSNTMLGTGAGRNNNGNANVFVGYQAGFNETGSNKLYIDNTVTASPLIYGNFAADSLKVNGTLTVNNAYTFPATAGSSNYLLQTNGAGQASWVNPASITVSENDPQVSSATNNMIPKWNGTSLVDGSVVDDGTNIGIGTTTPTDKVHIVGNLKIDGGTIPVVNTGETVSIGNNAGNADDLSNNENVNIGTNAGRQNVTGVNNVAVGIGALQSNLSSYNTAVGRLALNNNSTGYTNVAVGESALRANTTGFGNVVLGSNSLRLNTNGNQNTSLGHQAGFSNTGSGNVFIGNQVGYYETGTDKLYIDNSFTATPLIYGNFAADSLKINGTLTIKNAYTFPSTPGTANYVLQTNGSGQTNWVNPSALAITETDPKVASANSNSIPKWNGTSLVDGSIADDGINVGIGTTTPSEKLDVNGKTKTTNLQVTTGASNDYVLQSDAAGNASWVNSNTLSVTEIDPKVASTTANTIPKWNGTSLIDGQIFDNGINVGVGTLAPTEKIHLVGNIKVDGGKMLFVNTGESVFIGNNAGNLDDYSANQNVNIGTGSGMQNITGTANVGVGYGSLENNLSSYNTAVGKLAMNANTTGYTNVAVGESSLRANISGFENTSVGTNSLRLNTAGSKNTALGQYAGYNSLGSGNVFLGNMAGFSETGSDKLYIDNSTTAAPLIYGNFASDSLKVNGTLTVNNAYTFPGNAGTANYLLQTNGLGQTTWVDPATLVTSESDPKVSSATSNYIPKWNGTALVDGQLIDNGTNIGVGTATPSEKLDVNGKTKTTSLQLTSGAVNGHILQSDASGNASWVNVSTIESDPQVSSATTNYIPKWNGTTLIDGQLVDNGTNVGIGTATPSEKLHILNGNILADRGTNTSNTTRRISIGGARSGSGNSFAQIDFNNYDNNNSSADYTGASIQSQNTNSTDDGDLRFLTYDGTLTERMIITNDGNIGIGTSAPSFDLSFSAANKTIGAERSATTGTYYNLTVQAGGGRSGQFNQHGGDLVLSGGISTGNGGSGADLGSNVIIKTATPLGSSSTADQTPTEKMRIMGNGNVGIGTTNPTQAKLVINGSQTTSFTSYGYLNRTTPTGTYSGAGVSNDYSIYASDRIAAPEFNAYSDSRIKNIKGRSNGKEDLETLKKIEITNYSLKDSISKGNAEYKKVIAQQVESVYPQAVSRMVDVVPDIYKLSSIDSGLIHLQNTLKSGEKVKLIFDSGEQLCTVLNATPNQFSVDVLKTGKVFVYGRQVNDFRTVDYEAISMLNVSATQELINKMEAQEEKIKQLTVLVNQLLKSKHIVAATE